jgi:hypothetical protein
VLWSFVNTAFTGLKEIQFFALYCNMKISHTNILVLQTSYCA